MDPDRPHGPDTLEDLLTNAAIDIPVSPPRSATKPHDTLTRAFHWATAALVFVLYGLYLVWERTPKGDLKHLLVVSHLSLGAALTLVLAGRIVWRSSSLSSRRVHKAGLGGLSARAVHASLYVLLVAQVLLGWNFRWAQGQPMSVFGMTVPSPFAYPAGARHTIAFLHYWIGTGIVVLAVAHVAAALFHHFVLGDDVLRRMIPIGSKANGD